MDIYFVNLACWYSKVTKFYKYNNLISRTIDNLIMLEFSTFNYVKTFINLANCSKATYHI